MSRLVLLLMIPLVLVAQSTAPSPARDANLPAQQIGPNDLISVTVYASPELTRTVRVSKEGLVRMPLIKRQIHAEGLLPEELEGEIAAALREEQILVDPVVTVNIAEYHSRPVNVAGAVNRPLTFQADTMTTLLDAVTRAGGLSPEAGPEILVSRAQPGPDGETVSLVQRIPVGELLDGANPQWNIKLYGGEEIRVPEAGRVFVVGNVKKPGAFLINDNTGASVLKLLALSEGLAPYAHKQAYIYRPDADSGEKHEIEIALRRIMDREEPDVPLLANDILYIPDNRGERTRSQVLQKIVGFGSATASGVLIWGAR